jgi:hypothetical protein
MRYQDEFSKSKLAGWIILFIGLFSLLMCASCGVRTKSTHSFVEKVDSTFTQVKKETAQIVKDSAKVIKTVYEKTDSSSLEIEFQGDTTKSNEPVIIEYDTIGRLVINAGGRKLKSITTTKKEKRAEYKSDSAHVVNGSTLHKSDSTNIDLSKSVKSVSSKKFVFAIPWYAYVILIAIGILVWLFWSQLMAAKKIAGQVKIPYSNPNNNK